jgi:HK97 family phage prohead protease
MIKDIEIRALSSEVRVSVEANGTRVIEGMIPYNSRSLDLGNFVEEIAPGAFADALAPGADVLCLRDHDEKLLLGRTKSGTLTLKDSPEGLHYTARLPKTTYASDLAETIDRRDIDAASFGFVCKPNGDTWKTENGKAVRTLTKVNLFEISPCSFAAYPASSVSTSAAQRSCPPEIRTMLRGKTEKRHSRVLAAISGSKWAMLPEKLETIVAVMAARAAGTTMSQDEVRAAMMGVESSAPRTNGTVAILPVYGTISNRANMFSDYSGGTSIAKLTASFRAALADPNVKTIVFDVDSPGGTVDGVPEFAAEIFAARAQKPTIAVANTMAASAAFWLATAAGTFVCAPSGEVGSVGVYMMHEDWSVALEKEGVDVTFIKAGENKTGGNPYEPLSSATEKNWQASVNATYADFTGFIAKARGVSLKAVTAGFGQGLMVGSADALAEKMIDRVATLDQVLAELGATDPRTDGTAESATARIIGADITCGCQCAECRAGDCADCTDPDCDDPGCVCNQDDTDDDNPNEGGYTQSDAHRNHMHMELELRKRRLRQLVG